MGVETFLRKEEGWRSLASGRLIAPSLPVYIFTHGREVSAPKVGIAGLGLLESDLPKSSSGTFTTPSQTIENRWFTNGVVLAGDNQILRGCIIEAVGPNAKAVRVPGQNVTIENCLIRSLSGQSFYVGVEPGIGTTIRRCDISLGENLVTSVNDNVLMEENYMHNVSAASNPGGHRDVMEIYAGNNVTVRRNRLWHGDDLETSVINIAPWGTSASTDNVSITDNFIDGAGLHMIIDLQSPEGHIRNTRVLRNDFGGHTYPGYGIYNALLNSDHRLLHDSEAGLAGAPDGILWPFTGPDVNHWAECSDLVPDRTGEVAYPGDDGL